ncbi:MAG: dTDP-4-dehydrorhamnose 3,5-epimerase [Planctomycetota bacterium]
MRFTPTPLQGATLIEPELRGDERGFFARLFCQREFAQHGLATAFVQVNDSMSKEVGTLRGMHYQLAPAAETKLVRCIRGSLWDCIVDLRDDSPTFLKWFGVELSADSRKMLYVPRGFAHGFLTLAPDTEVLYLVDAFYDPALERGLRWDDPRIAIDWPAQPQIVSDKDRAHPDFDMAHHLPRPT